MTGFLVQIKTWCASLSSGPEQETPEAVTSDAPLTPQKEDGGSEGRESELKKQEMLVQYLKDTESFALQVERAIAVINNMLYWKTTTGNYYEVPAFFLFL